jgi:hypothetical protein
LAIRPATEVTLMMHPLLRWRISGNSALMQRNAPK